MMEYERDEIATTEEDEEHEEVLSPDSTSRGSFGELEEVPGELDEARRVALEQVEIKSEANFDHDAENSHGHGLDLAQDLRDGDLHRLSSRPGHGALDYSNDVVGMDDDEYDDDDEEGEEVHQQQQHQHEDENEDEDEEETLGSDEHEVDTDEGGDQRQSDNEIEYGPKDDPHGDSRSETSSQRTVEVPYEEEIRVCLLSFYIEHNPEKIGDVPMLLEKYAGDEEQMLLKLEEKYDADVLAYEDALEVVQDYEEREGVRLLEVDDATSEKDHQSRPPSPLREPDKREFAEPFGTIERIWLTTKPELLLGISYHEHARAILLQLNESFMRQESVESVLQTLRRAHKYYLHGADEALEEGIRELKDVLQSHDRREDRADAAPEDDNGEDEVAAESPQPHHEEDQRLEAASEASSTLDAERESASDESSVEDTATGVGALIRKNEAAISAVQEQEAVNAPDWMWEGREFDDDGDDNGNEDESKRPQETEEDQDDDRSESMSEGSWDRDTEASAPENSSHQQEASPEIALPVSEKEDEMLMSPLSPSTGEETSSFGDGGGDDDDDNENVSISDGENSPVAPPVPSRTQFDALDTAGLSYRDRVDAESVRQWKKRLRLMDNALFEIIDTERQYFNHLDTINDLVIGPMLEQVQKRKIRFTQKGADALLGLLRLWPKLTKFHGNLNERLWRRCVDENARQHGVPLRVCWDESSQPLFGCLDELASLRGACFMYEDYCSQYAAAVANYAKELQVNKQLGTFLRANCEGALRGGSLENFLIMPVQRICKYPLLLQAVASHQAQFTPLQREACEKINRAIRDTASWVEQIDVSTSKTSMYEAMANITRRLRFGEDEDSVSLTEPHRALLKAETLAILRDDSGDRANAAQGEMRFVILYNDVLLLTVARKSWLNPAIKVYDVMQVLPLREAVCVSIAGIGGTGIEPLRLESDAWRLTQTLDLLFETSAQADAWKAGVESALAFANNEVNAHRDGSLLAQLAQRINSKRNQSTLMRQLLEKPSRVSRAFGQLHQAGAITIQRTFRGLCGRRRAKARKDELSREVWAAMTIQRAFKRMRKKLYWSKQRRLEGEREARVSYEELRKAAEDDSSSGDEDEDEDDAKNENALEEEDPYSDWDDTASEAEAAPPRTSTVDGGDSLDDFGAFDEAVGLRFDDDDDDDDDDVQRV
ncbi:Rho guanine nucleotide exchange factor, putative [Hondaea fermentalgiana]|uniref:Rho guanine nucleotide exchange factor, putative n=1 Tax=Hondaea fermentalgiana TaxID=2315210 RepID=A0A2R5GUR5_9STRA|nr:Rho guanine nucleotide exchange factor, putative [Hondaea fermentalgiana]|eukprot:GBG34590.1 Rho guanine nucleotide exchange factor, putative [Hondaea fermentalgiana]